MTGARIEIDLNALRHNVEALAALVSPARAMVSVNANAHGHGLVPIAFAALEAGAHELAVGDVPTAVALRREGIDADLFAWLHGVNTDFAEAVEQDVDLGISGLWQLEAIAEAYRGKPARVRLCVDTGLQLGGASPSDWPALVSGAVAAESAGRLTVTALWSSLPDASPDENADALARFHDAIEVAASLGCTPPTRIIAGVAGIHAPEARLDLVDLGVATYGLAAAVDSSASDLDLRPVMAVRAPVASVVDGVARVLVGSADGIPPVVGQAEVAVRKRRHSVLSIDVDSMSIDVAHSSVVVGDEVTIFGPGDRGEATVEQWADWAETIGDEVLSRAGDRLPRFYLGARRNATSAN